MIDEFLQGTNVLSATKKETGQLTGIQRRCQMEGCLGIRLGVRWPDRKLTWPCTKGMYFEKGKWVIREH